MLPQGTGANVTDRIKRNVDDVAYREASDLEGRPMRHIIQERKSLVAGIPKKVREDAYRERAGMIAVLGSCLCDHSLAVPGHRAWCPSTAILASMRAAGMRAPVETEYASSDANDTHGDEVP